MGKYFSGNYHVKFGHFGGKYHVKFGTFVNFSGNCHKNSGIWIIFLYVISGQKCLAPQELSSYAYDQVRSTVLLSPSRKLCARLSFCLRLLSVSLEPDYFKNCGRIVSANFLVG